MMDLPETYRTALVDGVTQTVVQEAIFQLKAIDEEHLIALDKDRRLLGVVDREGRAVSGFPAAETYYDPEAALGRIVASSVSFLDNEARRTDTLLDVNLNPLFSAPRINRFIRGCMVRILLPIRKTGLKSSARIRSNRSMSSIRNRSLRILTAKC